MLGEDLVSVMEKVLMRVFLPDNRPQLLQRPVCARVRCHVYMRQSTGSVLDDNKYIQHSERRSDTTGMTSATIKGKRTRTNGVEQSMRRLRDYWRTPVPCGTKGESAYTVRAVHPLVDARVGVGFDVDQFDVQ
jgi:hypothetical protein